MLTSSHFSVKEAKTGRREARGRKRLVMSQLVLKGGEDYYGMGPAFGMTLPNT